MLNMPGSQTELTHFRLNDLQIETILDRLLPLIAAPEDHEFFRGILRIAGEEFSSGSFAALVAQILKEE